MTRGRTILAAIGAGAVLVTVGAPAAVASYRHARTVAERYGEGVMAPWLPLTTDGMLVAAIVAMYWRRWHGQRVGWGPWLAFVIGMVATLAANVEAAQPTPGGYVVAIWPPVAFALTLELLAVMLGRTGRPTVDTDRDDVEDVPTADPEPVRDVDTADPVAAWLAEPTPDRSEPAAVALGKVAAGPLSAVVTLPDRLTVGPLVKLPRSDDGPDRAPEPGPEPGPDRPAGWTAADEAVRTAIVDDLMNHPDRDIPTARQIRTTHGIGAARAARIVSALTGEPEPVQ